MQVLHVIASMGGGGAERQLCYLAAAQRAQGLTVSVALLTGGPNLARLEATGARLCWLPAVTQFDPRLIRRLRTLVGELRPAVVQAWGTPFDIYCSFCCPPLGVPWILGERGTGAWNPQGRGPLTNLVRRWRATRAAAVIANSATASASWDRPAMRGVLRRTIPNALPLDEIQAAPPVPFAASAAGGPVILSAGRFRPEKDYPTLVQALRVVLAETPPATAVICGEGPHRARLVRQVRALGLERRLCLAGYVPHLWGWMKSAAVFVSTSRQEGRPNVVLEAAACGCPLVLSAIPEHREFLDETQAAFAPAGAPAAVAAAILAVLRQPELARQRAAAAAAAVAQWTPAAMAEQYLAVYRELAAAGRLGAAGLPGRETAAS